MVGRFVLCLILGAVTGSSGLLLVYHTLNDLAHGRAGGMVLLGGAIGVLLVILAALYLSRVVRDSARGSGN